MKEQGLNISITTVPSESKQETPATGLPTTDTTEDEKEERELNDLDRATEGDSSSTLGDVEQWVQKLNGGEMGDGKMYFDKYLPTTNGLNNKDLTDIQSETSGFTLASLSSSISSSAWVKSEAEIKPYIDMY